MNLKQLEEYRHLHIKNSQTFESVLQKLKKKRDETLDVDIHIVQQTSTESVE